MVGPYDRPSLNRAHGRGNLKSLCEVAPNAAFDSVENLQSYLSREIGFDVTEQQARDAAHLAGRPLIQILTLVEKV